jgi:MarR family transcriptional regulator, organic hydroperoxide resistance regulator
VSAATAPARDAAVEELRRALGQFLGAERRLRARDRRGPTGLSFSEVRALIQLGRAEEATAGELARAADVGPATMTGLLDGLEERGIVTRRRGEADRRCVVVTLTDEGRRILDEATARWQGKLDAMVGDVAPEDVAMAAEVLRRLAGLFDGMAQPDERG